MAERQAKCPRCGGLVQRVKLDLPSEDVQGVATPDPSEASITLRPCYHMATKADQDYSEFVDVMQRLQGSLEE